MGIDLCVLWNYIKGAEGSGHPAKSHCEVSSGMVSWSPYGMSSGQMAPQLVDMSRLPRVTKRSGYSDCLLYYFLFHNLIPLIIYIIFKYLKKYLFSRNHSPHPISWLYRGQRAFPGPPKGANQRLSALRVHPHFIILLAGGAGGVGQVT